MIIAMGAARRQTPTRALEATHLSSAAFWLLRSGLDQHANGSPVAVWFVTRLIAGRVAKNDRSVIRYYRPNPDLASEPAVSVVFLAGSSFDQGRYARFATCPRWSSSPISRMEMRSWAEPDARSSLSIGSLYGSRLSLNVL